LFADIALV